jgi:diguanylate cyclase (GGDEF)-like protein/PAS domain S-box-containing protein
MPTRLAAALFTAWLVLLGVAFYLVSAWPGQTAIRLAAGASVVAAINAGVRRYGPAQVGPWHLLSGAVVLSALGTAAFTAPPSVTRHLSWLPDAGSWIVLGVYPMLALVLLLFVHYRTGGGRDRGGALDALTVTTAVTLLAWTFAIGPYARGMDVTVGDQWTAVAFPVGDLLCVAAVIRLLTTSRRRSIAALLLAAGVLAMIIADIGANLAMVRGDVGFLAAFDRVPLYLAVALAALHPSMRVLTRPASAPPTDLGRVRLAVLAVASLIGPVVLVLQFIDGSVPELPAVAGLSGLTFLLVLARMAGVMASHRLALARERGLRDASAALVSAADADEVGDAVRSAVAQLLPADVPHQVVLALAVGQRFGSAAEMETTARLVPTRELDWAAAVRLSHFSMVLRCPLVLRDRPTGDPLVGVLNIGGPTWALLGLQQSLEVLATQAALALERIELSEEVTRRNSETYFRTLVLNTSDVILIVDDEDRVRYASPSAGPVLGVDPVGPSDRPATALDRTKGTLLFDVIHPVDRRRMADVLTTVRAGQGPVSGLDFRGPDRRRTEVTLEVHCRDLRDDQTVAGLVLTLRDVTDRRGLERELTHQAFHDALTGLANRVLFADRLEHALARAARDGSVVGVLFIDLDDFKVVNDTLGHAVGDQLLIAVADRIGGALRKDDTAARLGGDEFAALIENVQDAYAVEEAASRVLAALAEPVIIDGATLYAVASIGITVTPEADNADELLRQADLALYVAKGAGKNQWRRYQRTLHGAMVERLELRSALDHAVNEGHFMLQYQPILDLVTDQTVGFEALVRWSHPTRGIITPDQFIEVAEESGLIVPIGRWVLDQALHTVAQWRRMLPRTRQPYVSVNVSVRQFRQAGFVSQVRAALDYAGVPPQALMLEITETLLMGDDELIWSELSELQGLGIRIAIDDFGTGYSSLGSLRQRPIDVLKIDKTFIDDLADDADQHSLVAGIISRAQTLNLTVIAEGIETPRQREMLIEFGCPLGQGYLFSSAMDATEVSAWMTTPRQLAA